MKKISYKKILSLGLWVFALIGLFLSWSFAAKKQTSNKVHSVNIEILNENENPFINEKDVQQFFEERNDVLKNNEIKNVDIHKLEKALNSHPAVENSEISYSVDGELKISVTQRRPLVRVINANGESYYIDSLSKLMPLSYKSTGRVLVANGFLYEPYSSRYTMSVEDIMKNESLSSVSYLDDVYQISKLIYADELLANLIHQIFLDQNRDFILFPAIGNQTIILGKAEFLEDKLNKLKTFYTEGLNKTDGWKKYSTINLKYKNLVVCTKK